MAQVWIMGEMIVEIMRPEEGVDLDVEGYFRGPFPSGAPAIFIDTIARMGHSGGIIGGIGKDDFGKNLRRRLIKDGVDCRFVNESETTATGVAFVTYFENGERKFIFHMGNSAAVEVKCPNIEEIGNMEYFHVMGCSLLCNKKFAQKITQLADDVVKIGGKISFDPNIRPELLKDKEAIKVVKKIVTNSSILLPGVSELLLITKKGTVSEAVKECFQNPKLEMIALKNGARGCTVYTREKVYHMGTYKITPVDATGAGDCFDAAFLCGVLEGKNVEEIMKMASAAGALNAAAFGPMEGNISMETIKKMIETGEINE